MPRLALAKPEILAWIRYRRRVRKEAGSSKDSSAGMNAQKVVWAYTEATPLARRHLTAPDRYLIPAAEVLIEETVLKSRFLTYLAPAGTVLEAQAYLGKIRQNHPDATHHCWAYLIGPPGSSGQVGMSDDGEPHGTAGRPMLNVLSHCGVGDIVAVVVRYYGGTNLGKGGLVRAYSNGVQSGLQSLVIREKVTYQSFRVLLTYSAVDGFKRLLEDVEGLLEEESFGLDPEFKIKVPKESSAFFCESLTNLTAGEALVETLS